MKSFIKEFTVSSDGERSYDVDFNLTVNVQGNEREDGEAIRNACQGLFDSHRLGQTEDPRAIASALRTLADVLDRPPRDYASDNLTLRAGSVSPDEPVRRQEQDPDYE